MASAKHVNKKIGLHVLYFSLFFLFLVLLFKNAFSTDVFLDDFSFLHISHASTVSEFFLFFSPFRNAFYRPISTEVFYFLINTMGGNIWIGHFIAFFVYGLGLIFLWKILCSITKNTSFAYLVTILYGMHFTHIFQLYQLDTFQEVCLFTFLVISFYLFVAKKYVISILFFVLALLSKETALLFPIPVLAYHWYRMRTSFFKNNKMYLSIVVGLSILFISLYRIGSSQVAMIDIYKIHLSPHLIMNNIQWYGLWSLGFPNFMPNYMKNLIHPLPEFWNLLMSQDMKWYFYCLLACTFGCIGLYVSLFFVHPNKRKQLLIIPVCLFFFFLLFISPTLAIIHRWMVRLTIPLIFIVGMQAYILYTAYKSRFSLRIASYLVGILFIATQIFGVRIHESSSLLLLETHIIHNSRQYFALHKHEIEKHSTIYFMDTSQDIFHSSRKLKATFHDQDFTYYFFPEKNIHVVYGFETSKIPKGSYIINSSELTKNI